MKLGKKIEPSEFMLLTLSYCLAWYDLAENECGGELHVVLDDDNTDDYWLDIYYREAFEKKYDNYQLAANLLAMLAQLTQDQRNWVTYNIYPVKDTGEFTEVHEELEGEE
jgi:hypothetical protein